MKVEQKSGGIKVIPPVKSTEKLEEAILTTIRVLNTIPNTRIPKSYIYSDIPENINSTYDLTSFLSEQIKS